MKVPRIKITGLEIDKYNDKADWVYNRTKRGQIIAAYGMVNGTEDWLKLEWFNDTPFNPTDFIVATFHDGTNLMVLEDDIEMINLFTDNELKNYLTQEESDQQSIDFANFMAMHSEITFNSILGKWDTTSGIGYQTTEELFNLFKGNKTKFSVDEFTDLLHKMIEETKSMEVLEIEKYVTEKITETPEILKYRSEEWLIDRCSK